MESVNATPNGFDVRLLPPLRDATFPTLQAAASLLSPHAASVGFELYTQATFAGSRIILVCSRRPPKTSSTSTPATASPSDAGSRGRRRAEHPVCPFTLELNRIGPSGSFYRCRIMNPRHNHCPDMRTSAVPIGMPTRKRPRSISPDRGRATNDSRRGRGREPQPRQDAEQQPAPRGRERSETEAARSPASVEEIQQPGTDGCLNRSYDTPVTLLSRLGDAGELAQHGRQAATTRQPQESASLSHGGGGRNATTVALGPHLSTDRSQPQADVAAWRLSASIDHASAQIQLPLPGIIKEEVEDTDQLLRAAEERHPRTPSTTATSRHSLAGVGSHSIESARIRGCAAALRPSTATTTPSPSTSASVSVSVPHYRTPEVELSESERVEALLVSLAEVPQDLVLDALEALQRRDPVRAEMVDYKTAVVQREYARIRERVREGAR